METFEAESGLKSDIELIDRLLGIEARKPGSAAVLPAVIRVIESLEPAGGMQFPVFPASYAGDGQNAPPVYDLNGIEYGAEFEVLHLKDRNRTRRHIISARQCTIDSPQSQANRTEVAFLEDEELKSLVPQSSAIIPRTHGKKGKESVLRLPHRIADFRVRLSDKQDQVSAAISAFADGDSLKLLRLMPTSIVFGFWDSRGDESQHKHARLLLSRIDAFDVVPCTKRALYSGPYSKAEFAEVVLEDDALAVAGLTETDKDPEDGDDPGTTKKTPEKKTLEKIAKRGFSNALSAGLGGVLVQGKIERLSLLSLTDISRLWCDASDDDKAARDDKRKKLTEAARRYVFALAALAECYPRSTGSHRLRSGCELVSIAAPVIELRGGSPDATDASGWLALFNDRQRLVAIATDAMLTLCISDDPVSFTVSRLSLKSDFDGATSAGGYQPADGTSPAKAARRKTKGQG